VFYHVGKKIASWKATFPSINYFL